MEAPHSDTWETVDQTAQMPVLVSFTHHQCEGQTPSKGWHVPCLGDAWSLGEGCQHPSVQALPLQAAAHLIPALVQEHIGGGGRQHTLCPGPGRTPRLHSLISLLVLQQSNK